jgi:hypothetical protein
MEQARPHRFDVICAGQPLWRRRRSAFVNVTVAIARASLRVG